MIQIHKNQTNSAQASNYETELNLENFDQIAPKKHNPKIYQKLFKKAQDIGDKQSEVFALSRLAMIYQSWGQYREAIQYLQQQLVIIREINDRYSEANTLGNLGAAYQ
ncbi:MAG: tetratricopeptide repeat protein, partial [Microcystis aeruginosa G13-05]|nr:tetratricopeptide repeat protein [Microcystis aeruginosa G13-05]